MSKPVQEEAWLNALAARNNVLRSYHEEIAMSIVMESKQIYTPMFAKLKEAVENDWMQA
ncbi:MAG: hypothetical protein U0L92_01725 [Clostridia bacterium]|nr:hypothetical protein [Clostridia bacterium]